MSTDLGYGRVLAEVEITAEVALVADDLWQDVGVAGVAELSLLGELPDVHQAQEIPLQLVHLVHDVRVQRENLVRDVVHAPGLLLFTNNNKKKTAKEIKKDLYSKK